MRLLFLSILVLEAFSFIYSQSFDQTLMFDKKRQKHEKRAMLTLGGWAAINMTGGLILQSNTSGSGKYFHQMNAGWNAVNFGIAALGYWRASRTKSNSEFSEAWKKYERYQKSLLFNAGLDLGYIAGGFYLKERSRRYENGNADRFEGWGQSIILQGAFLFTFDIIAYLSSQKIAKDVRPYMIIDGQQQSAQIGLRINF